MVGAGLAGLHAAWRLHLAGVEVVVLEARDRVGGRTWSHALADGTVVERGGEFIAPDQHVLRGLCDELGLELIPHGFSFDRRPTPQRPAPTEDELRATLATARERVAACSHDFPASDAVVVHTPADAGAVHRVETSLTVPLREASARRLFGGEPEGYDPAARVAGGNQSVARSIARRLGERVRLSTPVAAVGRDGSGVTVRCADGSTLMASAVVVAVPLPLLDELVGELPPDVAAAASRTRFGDAAKLHVPLRAGGAPERVASPDALWWCWTSAAPDGERAAPVLSGFAGGSTAIAAVGAARGAKAWAQQALALCPDLRAADTDEPLVTHWGADPWTRGSYSAPGIGLDAADDAAWARPWGSIVFAGEHTAGEQASTMNGAATSGARAAATVLWMRAR
ncbi:MAG TPA: NAD(P)/FAD-dependent oxidoreductase [Solirubrobacteraceae bacterium]|nr:NAD(P)/FAD-dependent oxidoreductase [Solirubrobacteraceae bacterium]